MKEQSEALRLADELKSVHGHRLALDAAAELRRLHDSVQTMNSTIKDMDVLNTELLEALREVVALWDHHASAHGDGIIFPLHAAARAAIDRAEGERK